MGDIGTERREVEFAPVEAPPAPEREAPAPEQPPQPLPERVGAPARVVRRP